MAAGLLAAAARDPYAALRLVLGGPLHPGGEAATERLLERANVGEGDLLVDLGCGPGEAVATARERGARAIGLDERAGTGEVRARIERLPLATDSVDVAVAECSLCLAADLEEALAETARVLAPGGRLAVSDVTRARAFPEVPDAVAEMLCLEGAREREQLLAGVQAAGFAVVDVEDHHDDLLAMRDNIEDAVDVDGLLASLGSRAEHLAAAKESLEAALAARELGYVSVVARR